MEISLALDDLIKAIKESQIYLNYIHVLNQVEKNEDINNAVKEIKNIQKQLVKEKSFHGNNFSILEKKLEEKKSYLYSIPLYADYIFHSEELNDLIKSAKDKLQLYINDLNI